MPYGQKFSGNFSLTRTSLRLDLKLGVATLKTGEWNELSPGIQILILALMRTTSGGLLSVAVAIVILQVQFIRSHHLWIAWTILIIGFLSASISLYGMSMVRRKTPGRPLIIPVIIIFILLLIGFLFNIMG